MLGPKRKYNKDRLTISWDKYKRRRNVCVNQLQNTKKTFDNLNLKNIAHNKNFWNIIKLYLAIKNLNLKRMHCQRKMF